MSFVTVDHGRACAGGRDCYEGLRGMAYIYLTVTGPWYKSSEHANFGNVVGDCEFI